MGPGTRDQVLALLRELRPVVGFDIRASFDGPIDTAIPDTVRENLMAVVREAVTNIGRHAGASAAAVDIEVSDELCRLRVTDNGRGFSSAERGGGLGLGNLRRRADKLHGQFSIEHPDAGGTQLVWQVPLAH
jgi:signal transduction histidine kinase